MVAFLKTCGRGFIVIISSPFWLAFFALYIVYSLILFFYVGIKGFLKLFSKHRLTIETEYDRQAKSILANPNFNPLAGPVMASRPDIYPQNPVAQPVYYQQPQSPYPPRQQQPYQGQPYQNPYPNQPPYDPNRGNYPPSNYNPQQPYYPPRNNDYNPGFTRNPQNGFNPRQHDQDEED